jgi:hypothetical protein
MTAIAPDHLRLPGADEDQDHELVDRLVGLHPPRDADVAERMDVIRAAVLAVEHLVVDIIPRSADRTVAIRAIRQGGQEAIGALACNQHLIPEKE